MFVDKKSYLILHIYGSLYDEEFQEITINELQSGVFDIKLMESPIAINPADYPDYTTPILMSTATAYIVFVDFN